MLQLPLHLLVLLVLVLLLLPVLRLLLLQLLPLNESQVRTPPPDIETSSLRPQRDSNGTTTPPQ
eukprot:6726592-Alexandrium_andersonii.AAC.1